jgi:uncharacterized coiled-coil protein SlyX
MKIEKIVPYQLCPMCNGDGIVEKTPEFAYRAFDSCRVCNRKGIIPMHVETVEACEHTFQFNPVWMLTADDLPEDQQKLLAEMEARLKKLETKNNNFMKKMEHNVDIVKLASVIDSMKEQIKFLMKINVSDSFMEKRHNDSVKKLKRLIEEFDKIKVTNS